MHAQRQRYSVKLAVRNHLDMVAEQSNPTGEPQALRPSGIEQAVLGPHPGPPNTSEQGQEPSSNFGPNQARLNDDRRRLLATKTNQQINYKSRSKRTEPMSSKYDTRHDELVEKGTSHEINV